MQRCQPVPQMAEKEKKEKEELAKRLKALEEKAAAEDLILTEAQLQAMEKAKEQREAHGEIETEHPGYLGAQDTYYVGTIKGIGRIYQQTFIDTYTKVGVAKLYTSKHAITAADLLNDRVLPWFEEQEVGWYLKLLYRHNTMHRMDIRKAIRAGEPLPPSEEHRSGRQVNPPR